ncbi:putative PPR repeat family protein [Lyophyllum shimeji]|uniref:PPR repeat family protein n=1 Tax=Lyophyllum shimeji TaxID=47721 RepID=A0A9P3UIU3_LYOSH|nr:putative PPR repeat family protein [Lyophyllum shimeji]
MLLRAAARQKVILLDFLAPSLLSRSVQTRANPISLQHNDPSPSELVDTVKKELPLIHATRGVSDAQVNLFNKSLVQLRHASTKQDTPAVIKLWRQLEENRLLHFLQQSQVAVVANLLADSFTSGNLRSSDEALFEDVALKAAASRSTNALNELMVLRLKQNNPAAVIELYRRFMELLGGKEVWDEGHIEAEDTVRGTGLVSDDRSKSRRIPHDPGRVALLLAVTAAHAQRDAFQDALQTCLQTVVRFHHQSTKAFLAKFEHDPAFQDKVQVWVKRLHIARMVYRPPSLSKQISNLSSAPSSKLLEELYQAVINGLSGPDAYLAPEPSKITATKSVALTEAGWTSFLAAFLKCGRRDLASKLWTDMSEVGIRPGVSLWTALLDSYDSMRAVEDAAAAWNMMVAQGIQPEGLTYRALISTLFNGRKADEAMKVFQAFQKAPPNGTASQHTLSVYNTVINGLLSINREDEAQALLKQMEAHGPSPDLVSYNTFMAYYGRRGNFKALASLVSRMAAQKLEGDVFSFSTILSALLKAGRDDAPEIMFDIMRKHGIEPNVATYSAIIDHQMRERNERNLEAAMRMLQTMEQDPDLQPNEITYTSILAGLYRGEWLAPEKAEEWRKEIVGRMRQRGVEFTLTTYHILIKACLEYSQPEGLVNALAYYRRMRQRKIPLIHTTWYILLLGLLRRGEWAVAEEIINDMYSSGHQPTGATLDLVRKIRQRGGQ